jgi:hypothetical protein
MKKFTSILSFIALLTTSFNAFSQDEDSTKTFTISGSIDTYVHSTLGATNSAWDGYGPTTSFADLKGFGLGMANLIATYAGPKVGFTADLVFGPRGNAALFYSTPETGSVTGQRIINQMYAFYKVSDAVTFNLGQFNTFVGYEVISPTLNANYSTSYLFSNGPFNHTGLRVDFAFGDGMVAKLAVMNPTDMVEFNPVNTYTVGGQIGKTSDAGGIWLNLLYGDQDGKLDTDINSDEDVSAGALFQVDLTGGWTLSDAFYLGINTSYQTIGEGEIMVGDDIEKLGNDATAFFGVAVYPKFTLSESFALALRGEYFSITKGHALASPIATDLDGDGNVIALTATGNWKVGALTVLPEIRFDKTSEDFYFAKDGDATDSILSLTLAAVYKF